MFSVLENAKSAVGFGNENAKLDIFNLKSIFLKLEKKYSIITDNLCDATNNLKCIFCQDPFMKDVFNFYPDRLCIDFTYKCNEIDIFFFIFICEDSNGRNDIIAFCLSVSDTPDSFLWVLNTFKKHNPNWRKTKIITVDQEIKYKDIIRNVFPTPYIIICFHHALKAFNKGMETIKIHNVLSNDQIQCACELFKSMYNSHTQTEYELYYQQFVMLHSSIVFYFQEIWLPVQHLWRTGLDFFHENIFSSLNCFLETMDNTMKVNFLSEKNFFQLIEKLFIVLSLQRNEKSKSTLLVNPLLYSRFSIEHQISKILTPYAAKFVIDQHDLSSEIHMDCSILSDNYYFDNMGSPVNASISMCQCHFFLYSFLPCRHIFAVRKTLNLCSFDDTLIDFSWTLKYYQSTLASTEITLNSINDLMLNETVSRHELLQNLFEVSLPSHCKPSQVLDSRIEMLNQIISIWQNEKEILIHHDGIEDLSQMTSFTDSYITSDPEIVTSQFCKTEIDTVPEPVPVSFDLNKACIKKTPVSSKSFKMEIASSNYNETGDNPYYGSPALSELDFRQSKWNFKSKILDGIHVNYAYLCRIICDSKETCIDWLRQMELICTSMLCPTCGCGMSMKLVPRLSDGAVWVCSNDMEIKKSCSRRCSVRRGSWFELTNMSFEQILTFCYMWINGFSQNQILSETGISAATYISWNKLNRRVCEVCLMEDENYSYISKISSTGYTQVLEVWLEKCAGEDSFLKFLQDANAMHRKDSAKHSMG